MAIDRRKVGEFAMNAIDSFENTFEDSDPDHLVVGDMMLIVEVCVDKKDDDSEYGRSHVVFYASDLRPLAQIGMLRCATLAAEMVER